MADTMRPMARSTRYRFVRRPKWIAGHVLVAVTVVGFINLGFWQLRRHDERATVNSVITERASDSPAALADLIATYGTDPEELEFRRVHLTGTYLVNYEVLWQARTLNGRSGHDVLTPLEIGGRAVIVNRGWVPIDASDPPVVGAEPESLGVSIVGMIRPGVVRRGFGPIDPDSGALDRISRVDIERLQMQMDLELYPFYVLLEDQKPEQTSGFLIPQNPPTPDAGPHLNYAFQWFIFATIAGVGYPILLMRTARDAGKIVA